MFSWPAKARRSTGGFRVIDAPPYGIVGKTATLRVSIDDLGRPRNGLAAGSSARLTIRRDGEPLAVESVPVGVEHDIEVPITRGGPTVVEMTVDALPGEVSQINNRAVVTINGVRDRLRVLLVSGEPHMGERTWRRLLKADPAVDLVHFTIFRPPEKDDLTPLNELALIAFPVRELFQVKIKEFDLIILDRFQNRGTLPPLYLRNIADYVRDGGALLMSVGPEFAGPASLASSPLGAFCPRAPPTPTAPSPMARSARWSRRWARAIRLRRTCRAGARTPTQAGGSGIAASSRPTLQGDALMSGPDGAPLLLLSHVGQGRVALLLSDQIWLWSRGHDGGGPQAELLRRTAHWLMKEPELEEEALTAHVEAGRLRSNAGARPTRRRAKSR